MTICGGCSSFRVRGWVTLRACTGPAPCRGRAAGVHGRGGSATMWRLGLCPVGGGGERFPWLLPCVFGEARHNSVLLLEASWTGMDPGEGATMRDPGQVRVTGPLAEYAEGFRAQLAAPGYVPDGPARQLALVAGST